MGGWVGGGGGIGNKAQLRPAKAGAGAWPELGNKLLSFTISQVFLQKSLSLCAGITIITRTVLLLS